MNCLKPTTSEKPSRNSGWKHCAPENMTAITPSTHHPGAGVRIQTGLKCCCACICVGLKEKLKGKTLDLQPGTWPALKSETLRVEGINAMVI